NETIRDIYDGKLYKEILEEGLLSDNRDIVFSASLDRYQIFEQQRDDCWVILMINNNLLPEIRVKKENLLVVAIIPGPKQPKNFNTFMRPLINELKQLEEGILCWDAVTNENFTLHAHVIFWCGDIPAISKLMYITGHNSYMGCRFCDIRGIISGEPNKNHVYYPLIPPSGRKLPIYNLDNLPLRTHKSYLEKIKEYENQVFDTGRKR
ncbi:42574_t:CDS:2, partial [Gigaspora margarita]